MDPDDKDILWVEAHYKHTRMQDLFTVAGPQEDTLLPSDRFWGRLEKLYRDKGYFEVIEWGKVESKSRGKVSMKEARQGISLTMAGK